MRKLTTMPSLLRGTSSVAGKSGLVSKELWTYLLGMDYNNNLLYSYPISFICSTRSKYTFSFRSCAMYDSSKTTFNNKNKYEVIVSSSLFEKYLGKQEVCKFLVRNTDANYSKFLTEENVVNQSFTFAKATWNRAESSKYVMIEFVITLLLIMTTFAFIMNSMTMNSEKKKIGIKYSFGIRKKDIIKPYIYELVLYTIIGIIG
jgi:hypothetical protein